MATSFYECFISSSLFLREDKEAQRQTSEFSSAFLPLVLADAWTIQARVHVYLLITTMPPKYQETLTESSVKKQTKKSISTEGRGDSEGLWRVTSMWSHKAGASEHSGKIPRAAVAQEMMNGLKELRRRRQ